MELSTSWGWALRSAQRRRLLAAMCGTALLGACSPPRSPLRVGTIVFPGYELLFLARELGWMRPEWVRLIELQSSSDSVRALAAGKLEAALLTMDEMMSARAGGVDLRAVAVLDTSAGADQVLARPGITLANLATRRIAAEDNSVGALMLAALLDAAGLRVDQIVKVPTTQARAAEFYKKGNADVFVTAEPWAGQIKALGGKTIFDSSSVPDRILDVIAVRADMLEPYAEAIGHLVHMQFKALDLFRHDFEGASPLIAARLQIASTEVPKSFDGLGLPDRAQNQAMLRSDGSLHKNLPVLQSVLLNAKLLPHPVDVATLLDDRFVREGVRP